MPIGVTLFLVHHVRHVPYFSTQVSGSRKTESRRNEKSITRSWNSHLTPWPDENFAVSFTGSEVNLFCVWKEQKVVICEGRLQWIVLHSQLIMPPCPTEDLRIPAWTHGVSLEAKCASLRDVSSCHVICWATDTPSSSRILKRASHDSLAVLCYHATGCILMGADSSPGDPAGEGRWMEQRDTANLPVTWKQNQPAWLQTPEVGEFLVTRQSWLTQPVALR